MSDEYTKSFEFVAKLRGEPVRVISKPGLEAAERVPDAALLGAELVSLAAHERVLLLHCGHGALGVALARQLPAGQLTLFDPSVLALRLARQTLAANAIANALVGEQISLLPAEAGRFDRVVLLVPRSRALGRRWLVEALALLHPGGRLNIAGANSDGVQSLIADAAAVFGAATTLGYGRGCRVAEALRPTQPPTSPAWASEPGIAPGSWHPLRIDLPAGSLELVSLPGVFSYDRLDGGTALLLQHLKIEPGERVLDAGCGYGPIGGAAARMGAKVTMLDVNLLAVAAAQENIRRAQLHEAVAAPSDALEAAAGQRYDLVASNPPFHSGRAIDTSMARAFIAQAQALLRPGGRLMLVANRFLRYEGLVAEHFAQTGVVAENRAYRVLVGQKAG